MFVENVVNSNEPTSLPRGMGQGGRFSDSFQDILKRAINNRSNSRPPKMELTGILIPCHQELDGQSYRFKLGSKTKEYLLSMTDRLARTAKSAEWEEVTIKGYLNPETNIFDVEKLALKPSEDLVQDSFREPVFDVDTYATIIRRRGKLEPSLEYLAS